MNGILGHAQKGMSAMYIMMANYGTLTLDLMLVVYDGFVRSKGSSTTDAELESYAEVAGTDKGGASDTEDCKINCRYGRSLVFTGRKRKYHARRHGLECEENRVDRKQFRCRKCQAVFKKRDQVVHHGLVHRRRPNGCYKAS